MQLYFVGGASDGLDLRKPKPTLRAQRRKPALKETRWKRPLTGFLRNEGGQKRDSV